MTPDWQLPPGVDRGLHDYMASREMVGGYDAMMAAAPLAALDVRYCRRWFASPGRVLDLGCGTGRLAAAFTEPGWQYVGVDLSAEMLATARRNHPLGEFVHANLVELPQHVTGPFDFAACLFSTLGMIRGDEHRRQVLQHGFNLLRPGGRFVLHVHNRYFGGLGLRGLFNPDVTMPQAYGGAPLTLRHFSKKEAVELLVAAGFRVLDVLLVGIDGELKAAGWLPSLRAYGYLLVGERLSEQGV